MVTVLKTSGQDLDFGSPYCWREQRQRGPGLCSQGSSGMGTDTEGCRHLVDKREDGCTNVDCRVSWATEWRYQPKSGSGTEGKPWPPSLLALETTGESK